MKDNNKNLEEISKKFLQLRIEADPKNIGFNPIEIENFPEHVSAVNYLLEKRYLAEKEFLKQEEKTVKSIRYIWTNLGERWALI